MLKDIKNLSDEELLEALNKAKNVAERAFTEIYCRYSQMLFLYIRKILNNSSDVNDVFQEVWLRFNNAVKSQELHINNAKGYLLKIARNQCLTQKNTVRDLLDIEDFQFPSYDKPYEEKELFVWIDRASSLLGEEYREAFVLHDLQGMNYEEISEITGDSVPVLKTRVWRARRKIKETLAPIVEEFNK